MLIILLNFDGKTDFWFWKKNKTLKNYSVRPLKMKKIFLLECVLVFFVPNHLKKARKFVFGDLFSFR